VQNAFFACTALAAAALLPSVIDEHLMRLMEVVMDWLALNICENQTKKPRSGQVRV